jgi:hypothetical protein
VLSWGAAANASQYELEIATTNTFAPGTIVFNSPPGVARSVETGVTLVDGAYFWHVRGSNSAGNGPWSSPFKFTVDTVALDAPPTLLAPASLANVTTVKPAFRWAAVTGAGSYRLEVDNDPAFGSPAINRVVTGTSYTSTVTLPQGVYYWRMTTRDVLGNEGTPSTGVSFTVRILRSPANNSFTTDPTPAFQWYGVTGGHYVLQVDTSTTFNAPLSFVCPASGTTTNTSCTPTTALPTGVYYWRVLVDGLDTAPPYFKLTITPTPPAAPQLSLPVNGATSVSSTVDLSWQTVTYSFGSLRYQVQVDNLSSFASPDYTTTTAVDATTASPTLLDGIYYWRVRAINNLDAPGAWSAVRRFTVDITP